MKHKGQRGNMRIIYEALTEPHVSEAYIGDMLPFAELSPVLMIGPKGVGKTMQVYSYAKMNNLKLLVFEASEEARYGQLIGQPGLMGRDAYFALGVLPTAIEYANAGEKFVFLIEELNALSPAGQKLLNALLDLKKGVTVKEIGRRYELNPNAEQNMVVVATMAPSFYGGVFEINEDLKSRFNVIKVGYPPQNTEKEILLEHTTDTELATKLVNLATQTRTSSFVYQLSTRDLVQAVKVANKLGVDWALRILESKFEDEQDIKTFKERKLAIFGDDNGK